MKTLGSGDDTGILAIHPIHGVDITVLEARADRGTPMPGIPRSPLDAHKIIPFCNGSLLFYHKAKELSVKQWDETNFYK